MDKKEKIILAAEEIMSAKGLADSSISEIAKLAGVADSVIYQYFKGKEDLLFSIPGRRMKDVLGQLYENLQGIEDPESRLRKMVWFHLHFNETHREYARLLLLECRSSKDFYSTEAYQLVRSYAGTLYGMLKDGVRYGSFRKDLDLRLAMDVILGALDMETISSLGSGEVESSEDDFNSLADLIHFMLVARPGPPENRKNKANAIIDAAVQVFAEKGFTKAKISEIAERAGVGSGTVYEYFKSKDDLLLKIPVERFEQYIGKVSQAFEITSPDRRLRRLIKYHFSSFLEERQFLQVFLLELQLHKRFYGSEGFESFKKYFGIVEEVIEQGKDQGVFRSEVNARVFRNMFLGAFSHMALRWLILANSTDMDKMGEINEVTNLLVSAVAKEGTSEG